jgi:hypothetical protein
VPASSQPTTLIRSRKPGLLARQFEHRSGRIIALCRFLLANPDNRQMDASALVWNAILAKWPNCGTTVRR